MNGYKHFNDERVARVYIQPLMVVTLY